MPDSMAHVCRCPVCRGWSVLLVEDPRFAAEHARQLAEAILCGETVERLPLSEARQLPICRCPDVLRRLDILIDRASGKRKRELTEAWNLHERALIQAGVILPGSQGVLL